MGNNNRILHSAKNGKRDEFYTQFEDVAKEVRHYWPHLKNKVVYCNCDDPHISNFWYYFKLPFEDIGLRGLIATHYAHRDLFTDESHAIMWDYNGVEVMQRRLQGDGSFKSWECSLAMEYADVVITNPPFSLFRSYFLHLLAHGKQFLVLGNINAAKYNQIWPYVKSSQVWLGRNHGEMFYRIPDEYDRFHHQTEDGSKYARITTACWFTNLGMPYYAPLLHLTKDYSPEAYPVFDNYPDAINVDYTNDIPVCYDGLMGVPITFLHKYCPDQFEIVDLDRDALGGRGGFRIAGKDLYSRILIRHKTSGRNSSESTRNKQG